MKKTQFKKIISIILATLMLATMFTCFASAASSDSVSMTGIGSYEIFNSGCTGEGYDYWYNIAPDTVTNGGYDIYLEYPEESQIGAPFTVDSAVTDDAIVTILSFDVDEESGERDLIYLVDETDGSKDHIGTLSGMDWEWNTTSIVIDADLLEVGHTYHFNLIESVEGWVVWVRTVTLVVGNAFNINAKLDSTIDNDTAIISNDVAISTSLNMNYDFEFKAVNKANGNQYGSYFTNVDTTTTETTDTYNFALTEGAPAGEYTVYLYIKNPATGAVVLVLDDTVYYQVEAPEVEPEPEEELNFFQKIWAFFMKIFVFLGLS